MVGMVDDSHEFGVSFVEFLRQTDLILAVSGRVLRSNKWKTVIFHWAVFL